MRVDVAGLIPHQGAMCLLDSVESWDDKGIVCTASSHRRSDNPLRDGAGLRGSCAIEYGAQAVAAHAGLIDGASGWRAGIGFLAAVRDVTVWVARLDDIEQVLTVRAGVVLRQDTGQVYEIAVTAGAQTVLTGQIFVMAPRASGANSGPARWREK
jgi:predicted hotdog family 3-hydroxylacyl-ACP dehydratase